MPASQYDAMKNLDPFLELEIIFYLHESLVTICTWHCNLLCTVVNSDEPGKLITSV